MIAKVANKHERFIYRALEMVPGVLVWGFILSPIWLGFLAPKLVLLYITFLTIYWAYLGGKHTIGATKGYKIYQEELKVDWYKACRKLKFKELPDKNTLPTSLEDVRHFVLVPTYSEPKAVLEGTLQAFMKQTFPLKQITLVIGTEERYAERIEKDVFDILGERVNDFEEVLFYVHPAGIPDEAKGIAGANRAWAAKNAVGHMKTKGRNLRNYIFTTFDADSVLHPKFISRLTHLYLTSDKRDHAFYSTALHLFNNNIWEVPMMMRIEANAVTLASLSDVIATEQEYKETFSCYSASLQTLIDADYWDVQIGVDDTIFYWRAFFERNGDFRGEFHFIPYSADAVQGRTAMESHKSMYLQLRRWAWGTIAMPLSMMEFLKNKEIPFYKKIRWTWMHIERRVLLFTLVFLMTFGVSLITLVNTDARQINLIYNLPSLMSIILTATLIFMIPVTLLRTKIVKPMPKKWHPLKRILFNIIEGPLIIINLLTFSLVPWLDAYTRMLFGKRMTDLYHTPKVRTNN